MSHLNVEICRRYSCENENELSIQVYDKLKKNNNNAWQNLYHTTFQREPSTLRLILKSHWVQYRFCQSLFSIFLSTIHAMNCFIIWYPHAILINSLPIGRGNG